MEHAPGYISPHPGNMHSSDWITKPYSTVFTAVAFFLLIFGIAIFLSWRQFETARHNALTNDKTTANLLADLILEHNRATIGILQSYAHRPLFIDAVKNKDLAGVHRHLSTLKKNAEIDLPFVTDTRGILRANFPVFPEAIGNDLSSRDWYKGISNHWKPYISTVFKLIVGEKPPAVAVCVPVFDEKEKVIGILGSSQRLGFLVDTIEQVPFSPYATVNVIDRTGQILYSNKVPYQENITGYRFFPILEAALKGKKQQIEMNDPQKDHEKSYLTVVPVGDIGWSVVIERSLKDIYRSEFKRFIEAGAISFLLFLLIILFLVYLRKAALFRETEELLHAEIKFRQSEENFRHSFDDSPIGVRIVTPDGETIYANRAILDIYGYHSIEELKTTPVKERYTPESYNEFQIRREKRRQGVYCPPEYEISIVRKDGEVRYLDVLREEILWDNERQFQVIYNDITESKQAELQLKESEEIMRYIIKHDPNAIAVYDRNLRYIAVSNRYLQDYNVKETDIIGKHHYEVFPEMPQRWKDVHTRCLAGAIERNDDDYFERPDSSITYNRWECRPWYKSDGEIGGMITYTEVTTERKATEEELRASRLQLRALAARLQQIREYERIMIAREIHDEMGGGLTGLKMDLSWLSHKIGDADLGEARVALIDKIHTSNELIDQMIHVVRRISTDLRPSVLDDLGLIAALEWQLSEFTSRTEIPHEFATTFESVNMEENTAVAVFRIFQEALTNVARHSRATKVAVVLREGERSLFGDKSLVLEIRDNGRGITEEEILNSESLGLLGMKERVLAFGGELSIRGEPGGGTVLVLQIPRKQGEPS